MVNTGLCVGAFWKMKAFWTSERKDLGSPSILVKDELDARGGS